MPLHRLSIAEQTAAHLREGLRAGRWRGQLPGVVRLAAELGVSTHTLRAALRAVEGEGLVTLSEDGRSRQVPDRPARRPPGTTICTSGPYGRLRREPAPRRPAGASSSRGDVSLGR